MEIKGSAIKTIYEYVKSRYPDKLDEWLSRLPAPVASVYGNIIKPSDWYPLNDTAVVPTEILSNIAFDGDIKKTAWESGRFAADYTLKGIYRFFLMATPSRMVITTGGRILTTFYKPVQFKVAESGSGSAKIHIALIDDPSGIIENRIGGWIERALEIQGIKAASVEITLSLAKGDPVTEISIIWN